MHLKCQQPNTVVCSLNFNLAREYVNIIGRFCVCRLQQIGYRLSFKTQSNPTHNVCWLWPRLAQFIISLPSVVSQSSIKPVPRLSMRWKLLPTVYWALQFARVMYRVAR